MLHPDQGLYIMVLPSFDIAKKARVDDGNNPSEPCGVRVTAGTVSLTV